MNKADELANNCLQSGTVRLLFGLAVILLLAAIAFYSKQARSPTERMSGLVPLPVGAEESYGAACSGCNLLHGTELTDTSQEPYRTLHTADVAMMTGGSGVTRKSDLYRNNTAQEGMINRRLTSLGRAGGEGLTSRREGPNIWEVGNQLATYQKREAGGWTATDAAYTEHMSNAGQKEENTKFNDEQLARLL